jgi:hypothetical protein
MKTISRTIKHDEVLGLEAFCLQGYAQPFPKHFHDYYVLGFVVSGERELLCNGLNLQVFPGNLLIFNPRDNHECVSTSRAPLLHYLGFNILKIELLKLVPELVRNPILTAVFERKLRDVESGKSTLSSFIESQQKFILQEINKAKAINNGIQ